MIDKSLFVEGVPEKYPEQLLDGRLSIEGNVLACLFSEPTLYDDIRESVDATQFITKDGRFLFEILKLLRDQKFNKIDEITVMTNCPEPVRDKLAGLGGWKSIQKMVNAVDINNWEGIFDAFNKSNVLCRLFARGFNLFDEVTLKNGQKKRPIDIFSRPNCDGEMVLNWYDEFLADVGTHNASSSSKIISDRFVDFDEAFLDRIKQGADAGVSFAKAGTDIDGNDVSMFPFLSRNIMGLARSTTTAIAAHSGAGKTTLMMNIVYSLLTKGLSGVFVSNEMTEDEMMTIMLIILLTRRFKYYGVTKPKLKAGNLSQEDVAKIREAMRYWHDNYNKALKLITMSDADSSITRNVLKTAALRNGADFFVVDTFKLDIDGSNSEAYWINLIKDSRALDAIAKKHKMIGLYTIQLNAGSIGNLFLDESALSMSKGIKEVLSNLLLMREVFPEEFEQGGPYDFRPFRSVESPQGGWEEQAFILDDPKAVYRCLFINKTRQGMASKDNGVAYLFKYRGDVCKFSETCKVRPVHKRIMNQ